MDGTNTKPVVIMYEPLDEEKEDLGRSVFARINEIQQNTESTIEAQGKTSVSSDCGFISLLS